MLTNILALPLAQATVETGTNEDWVDSIVFLVGPEPTSAQLDLRGMKFEMEVRRNPSDHEVILTASTEDLKLGIGPAPDYGFLIISIPRSEMKTKMPGVYVADIIAYDAEHQRVCVQMDLTIVEGVTKR